MGTRRHTVLTLAVVVQLSRPGLLPGWLGKHPEGSSDQSAAAKESVLPVHN